MIITLDLETIPVQDESLIEILQQNIKPNGNCKTQEAKDKSIATQLVERVPKTSFNGLYGSICVIGYSFGDEPVKSLTDANGGEVAMLERFFIDVNEHCGLSKPIWVGHNHVQFDLPFLLKRCIINNVDPGIYLPRNPKPWDRYVFDTYTEMGGGSLDALCKIMGLTGKTEGMDGSMVSQYYKEGRIDEIASYCRNDVEATRDLYKRINFLDTVVPAEREDY